MLHKGKKGRYSMKLRLLAAAALSAAVSLWAISTGTAATIPYFEPLTTNVPYLAWRGEEIRLVKCATDATDGASVVSLMKGGISGDGSSRFNADWIVEDWSGQFFTPPQLEASTVKFFTGNNEYRGAPCVKADFVSLKAGLAQIKLVITDAKTGNPVLKHQFLAGWLGLNTPSIKELSSTDQPGGGGVLGDPSGNGVFTAGGAPGRVQVRVTGNLPLGNNFSELGLGTSINLPTEADGSSRWADLAQKMATTSDSRPFYRDAPWKMWDIHDDQAATEGHVTGSPMCPGATITALDAVDACIGAQLFIGDGEYSTAFGGRSDSPTFGPFDPLRPDETLLPDGKLDAGDVPMPSAIVEVKIAPNTGSATDIGGVGSLAVLDNTAKPGDYPYIGVFKCIPYSRDHKCTSNTGSHPPTTPNVAPAPFGPAAHNHYAPYYSRWQPATFATVGSSLEDDAYVAREASGNDGPPVGNNFPGYRGSGLYDYWQFVDVLSEAQDGPTRCLQRVNPQGTSIFRSKPVGPQDVLLFSDEHGEAQAYFNPGTGFFFDNLVQPNGNGGCDLRGITTLGTADISAVARYPYQKVTDPDKPSATIRKTVTSLFNKTVTCVPKAGLTGPETNTAFICTATAIDIDGTPFANERVCFTTGGTGAEAIFPFPLTAPAERLGDFTLCVRTNSSGQAQVEILGKCGTGNVFALFQDEGILRLFGPFNFGCPTAPPPGPGGSTTTTTTTVGTPGSPAPAGVISVPAAPASVIAAVVKSAKATAKPTAASPKATVTVIRIQKQLFAKQSARYVLVRVKSKAKTARVQVSLVSRNGKVLSKVTRVVPTNKLVRVPNLKLPNAAINARVRVVS
jgi:hypothetical protein